MLLQIGLVALIVPNRSKHEYQGRIVLLQIGLVALIVPNRSKHEYQGQIVLLQIGLMALIVPNRSKQNTRVEKCSRMTLFLFLSSISS